MAVNTLTTFGPDVGELVEEAFERAGLEMTSGYDLRTARRSLDFMLMEWVNRGINLWTVEEITYNSDTTGAGAGTATLVEGTATYTLLDNTVAILDTVLRTDDGDVSKQIDYVLNRISRSNYIGIPSKLTQARPTQIHIDRQQSAVTATFWPVPDASSKYKLVYNRIRRMTDSGPGGRYNPDVPDRFWPALVAGLAYNVACKRPEVSERLQMLKANYEEQFSLAADEDREKVPTRFAPGGYTF